MVYRKEEMKPLWILNLVVFSLILPNFTWGAGNQANRTLTINNGMGVNNGTNRTTVTPTDNAETACAGGGNGSCNGGPFADTSDPFNPNHDCSPSGFGDQCSSSFDPALPGGFTVVDNRFGRGAPCGPNDANGPPFPYPCHTKGSINQIIPFGMNDSSNGTTYTLGVPLTNVGAAVGQPHYQFRSDTFGTLRVQHIEYGFSQNLSSDSSINSEQSFSIFFIVDSTTDSNGKMVGNAVGSYKMSLNDNWSSRGGTACVLNPSSTATIDAPSVGSFEAGMTGVITCVDRAGNLCQGSAFNPLKFTRTSFDSAMGCNN